jgi:hypothetical protein
MSDAPSATETEFRIHLDIAKMLPIIREAFQNKTLQMFTRTDSFERCSYLGPCAIGVCLSEEERSILDSGEKTDTTYSIATLITEGYATCDPETGASDIAKLQRLHDIASRLYASRKEERFKDFEEFLSSLEKKYRSDAEL